MTSEFSKVKERKVHHSGATKAGNLDLRLLCQIDIQSLFTLAMGIFSGLRCTTPSIYDSHCQAHPVFILKPFSLGEEGVCHYQGCPAEVRDSLDLPPQTQAPLGERAGKGWEGSWLILLAHHSSLSSSALAVAQ